MTEAEVVEILVSEPKRRAIIHAVQELDLPDCWIAAGFVRNTVWDAVFSPSREYGMNDIDVVYWKALDAYSWPAEAITAAIAAQEPNPVWDEEASAAAELRKRFPGYDFEVKNQARMHCSPARTVLDEPYRSSAEAVARWIETATALGIRSNGDGSYSLLAPYGLSDLGKGVLRPTDPIYESRLRERADTKGWLVRWPQLRFEPCI